MLRTSSGRRAVALVWALLQLTLPAFASIAEAAVAASAASRPATAHAEERSGPGCQPVHLSDCARCQTLTNYAAAPPPAIDRTYAAPHVRQPVEGAGGRHDGRLALPLSRAPPHGS